MASRFAFDPPKGLRRYLSRGRLSRRAVWILLPMILVISAFAYTFWPSDQVSRDVPTVSLQDVDLSIADAVTSARQAVLDDLNDAGAWGHYAMVLYAHQFLDAAVICFQTASELNADDLRWPYLKGMILAESDVARGLPDVRRAAAMAPENSDLQLRLAELLFDVRHLEESESTFRAVLKQEPDNPRAKLGLARVLSMDGRYEQAVPWARGAARALPQLRAVHELLAKLYHRLDQRKAADAQLEILKQLRSENSQWPDPILAEVVMLRADASWEAESAHQYLTAGDPESYARALQRLITDHPQNARYPIELARLLMDAGQYPLARTVLQEARSRHGKSAELLFLWGSVQRELGDLQQAVQVFEDVLRRKPDYAEAWNAMATTRQALGDHAGAVEAFQQVLKFEPLIPEIHVELARALSQINRKKEARQSADRALELAPGLPEALQLIEQLKL